MRAWLLGCPSTFGGADTERGHTALLWRKAGLSVSVLYFPECRCGIRPVIPDPSNPWMAPLREAGVSFVPGEPGKLGEVPGLAGGTLVGMCHPHALHNWPELKALGCKLIWSPCMTNLRLDESATFSDTPPTAVHFQSRFQASQLIHEYRAFGCNEFHYIRGAFDPLPFKPLAHKPGTPFVVGRLARACRTKWTPHLWELLGAVRDRGFDVRALCQGWDDTLTAHCGEPPEWATCLPRDALPVEEFLGRCHAMISCNWGVEENWPRVGLEAMSAGVPLVVENSGGWPEMLGGAGIRCEKLGDYVPQLAGLASSEMYRQEMIELGRKRMGEISKPGVLAKQWLAVLSSMQ